MKIVMRAVVLVFIFILQSIAVLAQDKLYMINGSVHDVKILDTNNTKITMDYLKNGKTKQLSIDKEDIFSIVYSTGKEVIIYKQDSLSEDNFMTNSEMSDYVAGQRDAIKGYKSPGTTISSVLVGAAAGFFLVPLLSPIPPALFIGAAGARWIKIKRKNVSEPRYLKSDTYVMGYDHAARGKRLQNALIGSGCGLGAGIITSIIISSLKAK